MADISTADISETWQLTPKKKGLNRHIALQARGKYVFLTLRLTASLGQSPETVKPILPISVYS